MASRTLPYVEYVRNALEYDPDTGVLRWRWRADRTPQWNGRFAGKEAGCPYAGDYVVVNLDYRYYPAHRLAWAIMTGAWPAGEIDHINVCRSDNRFTNLREAPHAENGRNSGMRRNNKSGFKGVSWDASAQRWRTRIMINRKEIWLGYFATPEEAYDAYCRSAREVHGEFSNAGHGTGASTFLESQRS